MEERQTVNSYRPGTPETKNYEINDLDDLEDCIEIFKTIVQELKYDSLKKSEISAFMAKYIYMEDSIFEGLEKLSYEADSVETQNRLLDVTSELNKLCYEFQEEWNEEYWDIYEMARDPIKVIEKLHVYSDNKISKKLMDLQDIAVNLTRMSKERVDSKKLTGCSDPFAMVEEEASKYSIPSVRGKKGLDEGRCSVF